MTDPFVGEIRIFTGNYAPHGWALCNGQILPISQNTALFSLLGTYYGGDGKSTFGLPNLQGRIPLHIGGNQPGPGLSIHDLGEADGVETVTLNQTQIPAHTHNAQGFSAAGDSDVATNQYWGGSATQPADRLYGPTADTTMSPNALSIAGNNQPHNNMQPYLTVNFIIALQGIFPPRS